MFKNNIMGKTSKESTVLIELRKRISELKVDNASTKVLANVLQIHYKDAEFLISSLAHNQSVKMEVPTESLKSHYRHKYDLDYIGININYHLITHTYGKR